MAQQQFTFSDLRDILVNRVGLPASDVVDDPNKTFDELGLDSLAFVEIQLEMEQRYGFRVADEDAQQITTIGDAIAYVNRRLQEKE